LKPFPLVCLPLTLCVASIAQPIPNAIVHLYRTGHRAPPIQISMDGQKVFKIGDHKSVSFSIRPGYHQFSANYAKQNPTTAIQALPGKDYYFDLDMEIEGMGRTVLTAGFGAPPQFIVNLARLDAAPEETTHEDSLNQKELAVLATSSFNPLPSPRAQTLPVQSLTDDEIQAAILQGEHDPDPSQVGLRLNDTTMNLVSHAITPAYAVSGFTAIVYSPSRWIEYQAAVAKRQLRPFTIADVTSQMRVKALHVVALPSSPDRLNAANMSAASGVLRVVICDKNCSIVVQPLTEEQGSVELNSALRSMDYTKIASTFNMAEVDEVRHAAASDAFYIAVVGENGSRKLFEVRNRLFSWM
jgi:hypothetical protein